MKRGLVFNKLRWAVCNLGNGGCYGLKHDEKGRIGDNKTGCIKLCTKMEIMVFESEKGLWYTISRKNDEKMTPKSPKIMIK